MKAKLFVFSGLPENTDGFSEVENRVNTISKLNKHEVKELLELHTVNI